MSIVKKAVIPIAGYGSRMFPETLLVNKALLPIGNKPAILFLLEEIVISGIKDVYIIISQNQTNIIDLLKNVPSNIEDNFKNNVEIKHFNNIINSLNFYYIIQNKQNGLASALLLLKDIINEPFALLLGDNIILPINKGIPLLLNKYIEMKTNIIETIKVEHSNAKNYGIAEIDNYNKVTNIVEKPLNPESNLALCGRYILNPTIFDYIKQDIDLKNELLLPYYIMKENTYSETTNALWLDVGSKTNFLKSNILYNSFIMDNANKNSI